MSGRRVAVLADHHMLFMDRLADRVSRKIVRDTKPKRIILLGDLLDLPSICRFKDADLYEDSIDREFKRGVEYLTCLRDENPAAEIDFLPANHEDRFPFYIAKNIPRLRRIRGMSIEEQLDLDRLKIRKAPRRLYIGGRSFLAKHGSFCGVASGRKELTSEMVCGISAHMHTNSMTSFTSPGRKPLTWFQVGCLCDLSPRYKRLDAQPSSWQHGMALLEVDKHGVRVELIPIHRGVAYWRGRRYEA